MKTQYYAASSLDGFIATEGDSVDWLFALGSMDDSGYADFIRDVGALAMGSATYEWMLRNADAVVAELGSPWPYAQPAWVFTSRELPRVDGADIRFVNGCVRTIHAQMREVVGSKNIWVVGGGHLAAQFFDAGLLDELIVHVGSVTLGAGKPLLPRQALHPSLSLTSAWRIGPGLAELRYDVASTSDSSSGCA